jgi:5-methylcytosine-specific restriction endonuclease McrA
MTIDLTGKRKAAPTVAAIHNYWNSRIKGQDAEHWANTLGDLSFEVILEDNGKSCYACGKPCTPQRCHIIAHQFGGSVDPSNLFLMCHECHAENPDGLHESVFFNYVRNREFYVTKQAKDMTRHFTALISSHPEGKRVQSEIENNPGVCSAVVEFFKQDAEGRKQLGIGVGNKVTSATWAGALFMKLVELSNKELVCVS